MGPLLADQKYLADGEALFGSEIWKAVFSISFCFCLTFLDRLPGTAAKSKVIASLSRRSRTPKSEPTSIRSPVSSRTSLLSARAKDSPFFTLPPGNVHNLNPAAWRTRRTQLAASSIQAITDTSLVGRSRESLGLALRMLWLNHGMQIKQAA